MAFCIFCIFTSMLKHSLTLISWTSSYDEHQPPTPHKVVAEDVKTGFIWWGKAEKFIPPLPRDVKGNYIYGYSWSRGRMDGDMCWNNMQRRWGIMRNDKWLLLRLTRSFHRPSWPTTWRNNHRIVVNYHGDWGLRWDGEAAFFIMKNYFWWSFLWMFGKVV